MKCMTSFERLKACWWRHRDWGPRACHQWCHAVQSCCLEVFKQVILICSTCLIYKHYFWQKVHSFCVEKSTDWWTLFCWDKPVTRLEETSHASTCFCRCRYHAAQRKPHFSWVSSFVENFERSLCKDGLHSSQCLVEKSSHRCWHQLTSNIIKWIQMISSDILGHEFRVI